MLLHSNSQSSSPNMSTSPSPTYTMMLEREDDSQKWFELATDSEAEEAQKSYFFDNLNWESLNHTADDSSPTSPFEIGNSECKSFMSQNLRSPELGLRNIETKGSSAGMKNHNSERTHDNENFVSSHGQPSCSYNIREELPKEQSRACCEPLEQYNNKRGLYSTSQLGTDNGCRSEDVYRKRQPSRKSPGRSSRDEDVRQDNNDVADWERCRVLDSEGSSCVALDSKYADEDARRKRVDKEEKKNKVMDECALAELSILEDCPSVSDLRIPMSSMDDRKFMSTTVGGAESHLKEMTTQQKRRILINTSSNGPCLDSSFERLSYPYGSPERCWMKAQCKNCPQEDHSPSVTHSSGLPRSIRGNTSSRNSIGCGSTLYRSPNMATPVEAQPDGQRKTSEDGANADSSRHFKENDNDHFKVSSEPKPQRPIQANTEYDQESLAFDSRFLKRLNKISGVAHLDHDERVSQSSTALDLAEPPSPTVNVELKWKVEELERLVADERKKFHAVTERLAEQQEEADKNAQQMQDDWDGKIRELQKEKYDLSIRLQSTETAHLASLLAGRKSKVQSIQSGMQLGLSGMPSASSSMSHRRVSSHRHHEEFLKELEADQFREKSGSMKAQQITEQEAKKLKQEILQQEVLIRGYQHENEKAMQKIKEVQAEAKEKARIVTEENAKLASQLLQYQRRGMASGPQAATELSLQEALDREAQLKRLEVQLKQEIARLKDELTKAHAELERVEKKVSKTLDELESELASLKNSLTEERENHTRTSLTKEEVTKSLEENQRLLSTLQATTEQQAAQILELSSKVATYEGDGANLDKVGEEDRYIYLQDKRNVLVDDRRRIQPTLKQIKKPDVGHKVGKPGLSALAQVSRDESEKVRKLQMELAIVRKQSNTKEDESNRRFNMLKVELEKSKQEYDKRLQSLQAAHPHVDSGSASEQVAHNRVKSLETQVVNIRIHYSRKLKELTDKLAESRNEQNKLKVVAENAALQKKIPATRTVKDARLQGRILGGASLNVKELMDAKERIGMLEDVLDHRDHTIKGLQHKLGQIQIDGKGDDTSAANSITAKQAASLAKIKSKIQSGSPQRGHPTQPSLHRVRESEESTHASPEPSGAAALVDNHEGQDKQKSLRDQDSPNESEPDIVSLRKRLGGTAVNRDSLQQQCLEAMEKAARCSITHQQSLHHLQQASKMNMENHTALRNSADPTSKRSASGDVDWRSYNDPLERENRALQARLKGLSEELEERQAQSRKPMQVRSLPGVHHHHIHHNQASANVREEVHRKGSLFSEENPRRGQKWWQFS